MNKTDLRTLLSRRLDEVSNDELAAASRVICQKLAGAVDWRAASRLHAYEAQAAWHEIDLRNHLAWLRNVHPSLDITIGQPEPEAALPTESFDIILVPLLGFDEMGRRLGRGRGWYDTFLGQQPQAIKVGVALEVQWLEAVPVESHDIALDIIVSERTIRSQRNGWIRYN